MPPISLNEDNSHYFATRADQALDAQRVASWVDQYADTQVDELLLSPNSMRTSYDSAVWDPIWRHYDPDGPDDQPLLASLSPEGARRARRWIHTAWRLAQQGIDPYALWIARSRDQGISPWLSMRMNDIHNVDDEACYIHSEFWRSRPDLRRVPWKFSEWTDRAFDYGQAEVRAYHLALVRELLERYDCDGLELDWMRFGYHFRPGYEAEGAPLLTEFTAQVRELADAWQERRGHPIRLAARVPSRPQTALDLGMDASTWARRGLVDRLVITPFWATVETDMPIETWQMLLVDTQTELATGLELLVRPYPAYQGPLPNSLETVRGAAASFLQRGVERIYLFNYMDSETAMLDAANDYATMLREIGSLQTLAGKPRRHVVTYADTWAPGEPRAAALPLVCTPGGWETARVHIGPKPQHGHAQLILGLIDGVGGMTGESLRVYVNGHACAWAGPTVPPSPSPSFPTVACTIPWDALHSGYNAIQVHAAVAAQIGWVEIALR